MTWHALPAGVQIPSAAWSHARNDLVLSEPRWTHLMWNDADIAFSPEAFHRLLLSDHDTAAGVYPLKREDWRDDGVPAGTTARDFRQLYTRYTVNAGRAADPHVGLAIGADGFMAVREAPTGFMLIKRCVFGLGRQAYPDLGYKPDVIGSIDPSLYYRFFDVSMDAETGRYLSEDCTFCRQRETMGGKVYVDANSNLAHAPAQYPSGKPRQNVFAHDTTRAAAGERDPAARM